MGQTIRHLAPLQGQGTIYTIPGPMHHNRFHHKYVTIPPFGSLHKLSGTYVLATGDTRNYTVSVYSRYNNNYNFMIIIII